MTVPVDYEIPEEKFSFMVKCADGTIVMITQLPNFGASVHIYDDPESNPIVSYMGKPKPNV